MIAIVIFEFLCAAAAVFLVRVLIALHKDARTSSDGCVVELTSGCLYGKGADAPGNVSSPRYEVIVGGRARPIRRAG